jgi:glycosyltransferase involved in cell wall biosynthesis
MNPMNPMNPLNPNAISVVIPVLNGRRYLPAVLDAITRECGGREHEILVVDDGSNDGSVRYLRMRETAGDLRFIEGPRRGHAAAVNTGIREAAHPFIGQIDQDVIVEPGWMGRLLGALEPPDVAAAQGRYSTSPRAGFWARVMGRDLEQRYDRLPRSHINHVCTGNTIYRASALHQAGLLDESFGYAADNDLSYRLTAAGYRLAFCSSARSTHLWRETLTGYVRQQYGVGYGRLDVIAKHPRRAGGDDVSGLPMILHAGGAFATVLFAGVSLLPGTNRFAWLSAALALVVMLSVERFLAGLLAFRATRDPVVLTFPLTHLCRDAAWVCAICAWAIRRICGTPRSPGQGMRARQKRPRPGVVASADTSGRSRNLPPLVLIPAHNEANNLERVVADLRRLRRKIDILVVDDASTDRTEEVLERLNVRWLRLPLRTGVGGAIRTGIQCAHLRGYDYVVRIDGDAQHRACDLDAMLAPVVLGVADASVGSRYKRGRTRSFSKRGLALCLSAWTGRWITDPTSGYWVFGSRAIRLLARRHPAGYAEPELLLFLHRNGLRVDEVPIRMRPRMTGRTTLTWTRASAALARTLLALMIVPLRRVEHAEPPCE